MTDRPLVIPLEGGLTRADLVAEAALLRLSDRFGRERAGPDAALIPLDQGRMAALRAAVTERRVLLVGDLPEHALAAIAARIAPGIEYLSAKRGAGRAKTVGAALGEGVTFETFPDLPSAGLPLAALRPHHWVKNLLVFVPILAAHRWDEVSLWWQALEVFVAFCLASSSIYLVNDLLDIEDDRRHPVKRWRPIAQGLLRPLPALCLAGAMILMSGFLAWHSQALVFLAVYALVSVVYSLRLKSVRLVDLACLVGLYALRLMAGGAVTSIAVSGWLLAYASCIFASLALAKRFAELAGVHAGDLPLPDRRGYRIPDRVWLRWAGIGFAAGSALVLALYLAQPQAQALYARPGWLLLAGVLVTTWLGRVWWLAGRQKLPGDPIVFALRDAVSLMAGVLALSLLVLAAG